MFIKFRIMRIVDFGEFTPLDEIYKAFPKTKHKRISNAIDILGRKGFIVSNDECTGVSYRTLSSFYEYTASIRKAFFEIAVSMSTIAAALISLAELLITISQ